jgi:hypothetical protein
MKNTDGNFPFQLDENCPLCNHPQRVAAASMRELQANDEEIATRNMSSFPGHFRAAPILLVFGA